MAPARGGRLVRLANLRRLPLKHLHPELEVPDLIHNPLRRAAANDDGFRVVGQAHHDQRVPGAQRRSLVRVLDLRGGEAWEVSVRALWALAPAAAAKALQQSIAAHACPGGYGSPLKQHSHPSSAIRGCPPPRAWPARSLRALLCSTGPAPHNAPHRADSPESTRQGLQPSVSLSQWEAIAGATAGPLNDSAQRLKSDWF